MNKTRHHLPVAALLFVSWLIAASCSQNSETSNSYGLDVVSDPNHYRQLITENPDKKLVDLEDVIPGMALDIRYATTNNFIGQQIYNSPRAFARKPVAEALEKIQAQLSSRGLALKVFDAYRPYAATVKFYEVYPDTNFVAAPWHGSRHNRGCAVDVTLIDLKTQRELEMPTPFDDFSEKAAPAYMQLPDTIIANRQILMDVMTANGFTTYPYEWWHFDFTGWENYELLDLSFEELDRIHN
ncbi:MAG: M15 family metallopeptidase [Bacteroidales bacterium]